jgi:hypothetical protein
MPYLAHLLGHSKQENVEENKLIRTSCVCLGVYDFLADSRQFMLRNTEFIRNSTSFPLIHLIPLQICLIVRIYMVIVLWKYIYLYFILEVRF